MARELAHRGIIRLSDLARNAHVPPASVLNKCLMCPIRPFQHSITQKGNICPLESLSTLKGPIRLKLAAATEERTPGEDAAKERRGGGRKTPPERTCQGKSHNLGGCSTVLERPCESP